jgi:nucleotide-binding universal stress UspA family protein
VTAFVTGSAASDEPFEPERLASVDPDTMLAYSAAGSGIAVIAPLCFGATLAGIRGAYGQRLFLDAVGSGHELITYDQRRAFPTGMEAAAVWQRRGEDLWRVADAAGIERAVLYGDFDAGHTIAHAATQQPDRVLSLIFNLVPPAIGVPEGFMGVPEPLAEEWFGDSPRSAGQRADGALRAIGIGASDAAELAATWEQTEPVGAECPGAAFLRHADLRPLMGSLKSRSLVIEPLRRPLISGWGRSLAAMLPDSRLIQPARAGETLGGIHGFLAMVDFEEGHYASRVAAEMSGDVGATAQTVEALRRIVVPLVDTLSSERAAELACRLGGPQRAEIVLVHVVEIPLTRPLADEGGLDRKKGEKALQIGQAIVSRHGLRSREKLLFERSAAHGIVRAAQEENADLIVMAFSEKRRHDPTDQPGPTMREVLRRAHCEVLIDQSLGSRQ